MDWAGIWESLPEESSPADWLKKKSPEFGRWDCVGYRVECPSAWLYTHLFSPLSIPYILLFPEKDCVVIYLNLLFFKAALFVCKQTMFV